MWGATESWRVELIVAAKTTAAAPSTASTGISRARLGIAAESSAATPKASAPAAIRRGPVRP